MKNENRAVFDRTSEPYRFVLERPMPAGEAGLANTDLPPRPSNFPSSLWRLLTTLRASIRRRAERQGLLELSDSQLKDIGISRSQAYGGYSRYRQSASQDLERRCL